MQLDEFGVPTSPGGAVPICVRRCRSLPVYRPDEEATLPEVRELKSSRPGHAVIR